ncbi:uncharacterized protein LOC127284950 [Leptopilina boulardi]|uniref:uncharacterized protein LOC127284950 n=1 Tax=Leptopilina boulardi TaxID=63433 RepID=UPI0021F4FE99|nr:uncharacterized protein LOC127284950 [Leptopilina boulardi]
MTFYDFFNFLFNDYDDDDDDSYNYYYNYPHNRKTVIKKDPSEEQIDFFYPNACQICGSRKNLKRCAKCQMISYCGKQHQTEHWRLHKYYCTLLVDLRKKHGYLRNAKDRKLENWTQAKIACINNISTKLGRQLTLYEQKVIKFIRSCCICHDIDNNKLINCPNCASISICHQHKDRFHDIHTKEKCDGFKLCYQLDCEQLQLIKEKEEMKKNKKKNDSDSEYFNNSSDDFDSNDGSTSDDENNSNLKITELKSAPMNLIPYFQQQQPNSTLKFIEMSSIQKKSFNEIKLKDFEIPDLFIKPLIAYRALQILNQLNKFDITIHLIDSQINDLETCDFWETLFHLIPNLKILKIIILNPEFSKQCLQPNLCTKCTNSEKTLIFEMKKIHYIDYCKDKMYIMPNLIIGYLTLLKETHDALKAIGNLKIIPLALTTNCQKTTNENYKIVEKLFGKNIIHQHYYEKNLFCGVKPIMDYKTDGFYYNHQFLTLYKNFDVIEMRKRKMNGIQK